MRIGQLLTSSAAVTVDSLLARSKAVAARGMNSAWTNQQPGGWDPLGVFGPLRDEGPAELGTAIVPTYLRHPVVMATEALTVQAATGGRLTLGIGPSHEIAELQANARAELHAAEAKINGNAKLDPKAVPWWDGAQPSGKITGTLKQVDCLGKQARLVVEGADHKTVKLLVDPAQVFVAGGGQLNLGCGVQKPRRVAIEYFPKPNAKLATAGDVAPIEFQ